MASLTTATARPVNETRQMDTVKARARLGILNAAPGDTGTSLEDFRTHRCSARWGR